MNKYNGSGSGQMLIAEQTLSLSKPGHCQQQLSKIMALVGQMLNAEQTFSKQTRSLSAAVKNYGPGWTNADGGVQF